MGEPEPGDVAEHVVICKYGYMDGGHIQGIYGLFPGEGAAQSARETLRHLPGMGEWDWEVWPITELAIGGALPGEQRNDGTRNASQPIEVIDLAPAAPRPGQGSG